MQVQLKNDSRILALGEGGSGKTYLAKRVLAANRRTVVFTPHPHEWKEYPNVVAGWKAEQLFKTIGQCLKTGNCFLAIDDADIPLDRYADDDRLRYFLVASRHRGVGWLCISRRTADLPPLFFKQANHLFIFQTDLPRDLEVYRAFYGVDQDVKALPREIHGCLYLNRETREKQVVIAR